MMKSLVPFLAGPILSLCLLTGCQESVSTGRSAVPVVGEIVSAGGDGRALSLLQSFNEKDSRGAICIVGESDAVEALTSRFMSSDDFDNIDGRPAPDQLPDFAGETVLAVSDDAHAPYAVYSSDPDAMRSLTVNHLICALDTVAASGFAGYEVNVRKDNAKILVFPSPFMAENGAFDVDTLLTMTGSGIPVIFPILEVFEDEYARHDHRFTVAVLTDSLSAANGVYGRVFSAVGTEMGVQASDECYAFAADTVGNIVSNLLEAYVNAGGQSPLSTIIVDSPLLPSGSVEAALAEYIGGEGESNASYSRLIAGNVRVVDVYKTVTDRCYRIFRNNNSFTHNILFPRSKAYHTSDMMQGGGFRIVETDRYVQDND